MIIKNTLNQRGMTLVEIMVAASLLGGLALAGMTLFKTQTVSQKTVEANYEVTNLFQQIRVVLSDQDNCTASLGGANNFPPTGASPVKLRKEVNSVFTDVFVQNAPISGTNVKITGYRIERTPIAGLAANETWLKINFTKGKSTLMENTTKMMKVVYQLSGANIGTCYAYNNSTDTYWIQATPPDIYFTAGNVGIGTTDPQTALHVDASTSGAQAIWVDYTSNNMNAPNFLARKARGTPGSPSAVLAGDYLGGFGGVGYTGAAYTGQAKGSIHVVATENWTTTANGASILFQTTPNGSTTRAGAMTIDQTGNVGIGTNSPATKLEVRGQGKFGTGNWSRSGAEATEYLTISTSSATSKRTGLHFATNAASLFEIGTDAGMDNTSNFYIFDTAASAYRLYITPTGNVGIGSSSPGAKLDVVGSLELSGNPGVSTRISRGLVEDGSLVLWGGAGGGTGANIDLYGGSHATSPAKIFADSSSISFRSQDGATTKMLIDSAGNVGIGIGAAVPAYRVDVTGDIRATNFWATGGYWYSDTRLKKDVKDYKKGLDEVLRLEPKSFTWKKDGAKDIGFIAQDVKKISPDLVTEAKDKFLTIKLMGLFPMIVNAIQELFDMITGTQKEVEQLKRENQELRARLDRQDAVLKRLEDKASKTP